MAEEVQLQSQTELDRARELAARYHFEFVDLRGFEADQALLQSVPLDLMVKYEFFPLEAHDHALTVVIADPAALDRLDELEIKLNRRLIIKVASAGQLRDLLRTTEPSRRMLDEATEDFRVGASGKEQEDGE